MDGVRGYEQMIQEPQLHLQSLRIVSSENRSLPTESILPHPTSELDTTGDDRLPPLKIKIVDFGTVANSESHIVGQHLAGEFKGQWGK